MIYEVTTSDGSVFIISPHERKVLDTDTHQAWPCQEDLIPHMGRSMWIDAGEDEWTMITAPVTKIVEHV